MREVTPQANERQGFTRRRKEQDIGQDREGTRLTGRTRREGRPSRASSVVAEKSPGAPAGQYGAPHAGVLQRRRP